MNGIPVIRIEGLEPNAEFETMSVDGLDGRRRLMNPSQQRQQRTSQPQQRTSQRQQRTSQPQQRTNQTAIATRKGGKCNCNKKTVSLNGYEPLHSLGREFENLGCACSIGALGNCRKEQMAQRYCDDFIQRVKNHLINTRNVYVKYPGAFGGNGAKLTIAIDKILRVWEDDAQRNAALDEASELYNSEAVAIAAARSIANDMNLTDVSLHKTKENLILRPKKMRSGTVLSVNAIGEIEIEHLPDGDVNIGSLGTLIAGFGGLDGVEDDDDTIIAFNGMMEDNDLSLFGLDGTDDETAYILQGFEDESYLIGLNGKRGDARKAKRKDRREDRKASGKGILNKVKKGVNNVKKTVKIKAKNTFNNIKKAVNKTKAAVKKGAGKVKDFAKNAANKIIRFNPLSIAARNGFLLALKLNVKQMSAKLKWAYATPEQAKKGGLTIAEHAKVKDRLKKVENLFVKKLQGNPNSIRNAVLKSKAGKLNGLNYEINGLGGVLGAADPVTATALAAAAPIIIAIVKILGDIRISKTTGENSDLSVDNFPTPPPGPPTGDDTEFDPNQGGFNPNQGGFNPSQGGFDPSQGGFNPSQGGFDPSQGGFNPGQWGGSGSGVRNEDIERSSDGSYQDVDPLTNDPRSAEGAKKDNMPLIIGGLSLAAFGFVMVNQSGASKPATKRALGNIDTPAPDDVPVELELEGFTIN